MVSWEWDTDRALAPVFGPPAPAPVDPAVQQRLSKVGGGQGANAMASSLANGIGMNQQYAQRAGIGLAPSANPGPNEMAAWEVYMKHKMSPNSLDNAMMRLRMGHQYDMERLRAEQEARLNERRMERQWQIDDAERASRARMERMRAIYGQPESAEGAPATGARAQAPSPAPSADPSGTDYGVDPGVAEAGGFTGGPSGFGLDGTGSGGVVAGRAPAPGPSGAAPAPAPQPGRVTPSTASSAAQATSNVDRQLAELDRQIQREQSLMDRAVVADEKLVVDAQKAKLARLGQLRQELVDQRKAQSAGDKERDRLEAERQFAVEQGARAYGGLGRIVEQMRRIPDQMRETYRDQTGTFGGGYGFDSTIGPEVNMTLGPSWMGGPNIGGIPSWIANPGNSFNETRNAIQSKADAINLTMKGIVRQKGEGDWTDSDQAQVNRIIGNLLEADDEREYNRRLDTFMDTLTGILAAKGVPPEVIEEAMRGMTPTAPPTQAGPGDQSQGAAAAPASPAALALERLDKAIAANPERAEAFKEEFRQKFGRTPEEARIRLNGEPPQEPGQIVGNDMRRTADQSMTPGPQEARSMAMALRRYDEMIARNPGQKAELDRKFTAKFGMSPEQARTGAMGR